MELESFGDWYHVHVHMNTRADKSVRWHIQALRHGAVRGEQSFGETYDQAYERLCQKIEDSNDRN